MVQAKINAFKRKIVNSISPEFSKRIHARIDSFYRNPEVRGILHRKMNAEEPISAWKEPEKWQLQLNNKHNSREFAKKHDCRVPELYWQGKDVENIPFDALPHHYVIRPTTGYSAKMVFLMHGNKNLFDNRLYIREEIISELASASSQDSSLEFLIEEFVTNEKGEYPIPDDYKIYTFNGEVACVQVINRTGRSKGSTTFYDENWQQIERVQKEYSEGAPQNPPSCLGEMIEAAKTLSKAYEIFVRIDFYATQKGAVFGEFTPTPFRGNGFTSSGRKLLIGYWDEYCKGLY